MNQRVLRFSDVFPNYDASSQLQAIRELLETVFTWRNELRGDISEAQQDWTNSEPGLADMAAEAATTNLYLAGIYRDAAAVQAAVGAIAPFIEGFFVHAFEYLKQLHGNAGAPSTHARWHRSNAEFWNPRKPNLIQGIRELREALSVVDWFTNGRLEKVGLLFVFRNRSLHLAYEWPPDSIAAFERCVQEHRWNDYIAWARVDGIPWVAYLKDSFLTDLLSVSKDIVVGFEQVAARRGSEFLADPGALPGFGPAEEN